MNNFLNWLITSSADPKKTSVAIKGAILIAGSELVRVVDAACAFGLTCLGVTADTVNQIAQGAEIVVYGVLLAWGGLWLLFGIFRKIDLGRWSAAR